ncbi:DNA polymerase subunit gamma-2, mitochondrial [Megalops cyprinoides]|uniref:DNA polymerase subunit gamma-2, mitochondrial n=1 Tax=Megalops cyprinoides TaxID=118141 RepID=UPI0018651D94|nr:DNA polymerase subunit gamma-2, mitochondrial [Megalops cyprinoides]
MLTYCVRRRMFFLKKQNVRSLLCGFANPFQLWRDCRSLGTAVKDSDHTSAFMQFCSGRYYIIPDQGESFLRGISCAYGPLGMELRKNMLDQWWTSVVMSKAQVFGINTLHLTRNRPVTDQRTLKLVDCNAVDHILSQRALKLDQVKEDLQKLLQNSAPIRSNLLQGALEQYLPSLELVNRRLPFGLAETGVCYQPLEGHINGPGCPAEVTQASLVWFCSPRTSSQWLDYWARQRLQWWRKFAMGPSSFSSSDIEDGKEGEKVSRGVRILYQFPWGAEPLETLCSLGDEELLQLHKRSSKLQCKDGRKSVVPHVISVCANIDRGVLAYLHNSLQEMKKTDSKRKLHSRKVLKLHPSLAPVKVALDMGRGPTVELRQVCEALLHELLERGISTWPGYLETMQSSMEQLNTKYDEMGVLFTVVITDSTLENGLVQVRSRDTTIKETMHIAEIKAFFTKYVNAAENI